MKKSGSALCKITTRTLSSASSSLPSLSNSCDSTSSRRFIADECDPGIELEPEAFVVRVSHGRDSISVTVPDGRSLSAGRLLITWGVRSAVLQTTQFLEQENERFVRPSRRLPKAHLAGSIRGDVGFGRMPNLR